jgi:hypothetical protein
MTFRCTSFALIAFLGFSTACSSTHVVEEKAPLPLIPEYVKVPHPAGFDLADLRAILVNPLAPPAVLGEFADICDEEFTKLTGLTTQKEERDRGAIELVKQDPERMHWCFYAKISRLQDTLQTDTTWTQRQKKIIETFEFLSPIAGAFLSTYHDSRYLRWAAQYYSKVSEWVFFKKLQPSPESSLMLTIGTRSESEPWISVQRDASKAASVFTKYGISLLPSVAGGVSPLEPQGRSPASVESEHAKKPVKKASKPADAELDQPNDPKKAWTP